MDVAGHRPAAKGRRSPSRWLAGLIGHGLCFRTARRYQRSGRGVAEQEQVYRQLMRWLSGAAFGAEQGLSPALGYEEFRTRIPLRTYEEFAPYLERMKHGEADVLHPGRCAHFAVSSGTTAGPSKWLPVNGPLLAHFRQAGLDSLSLYALRSGGRTVFQGRQLFLGGSTALQPLAGVAPPIMAGDLSGITSLHLPGWVERLLYEPGREIAQMADWPAKLDAIARRIHGQDIRMIAGIPSWLLVLARHLREHAKRVEGQAPATIQALFPRLECLVHGGVPIGPFAEELREVYGAGIAFHEVYPASEGFIAAQDADAGAGLRLLTGHGIFYEFLPLEDFTEGLLPAGRAVPLAGVRAGVDYVLLMTTPAGLVRYVIGDVVRFVSTTPPRLIYVGRTKLQLSAFGEHVIEKELTDAVAVVCGRHGLQPVNFHVAPQFPEAAVGRALGRHEWWLEARSTGSFRPPSPRQLADELDQALVLQNDDYAAKRQGGGLAAPEVHWVPPGCFEAGLRRIGQWGGQHKTPRCRSDRKFVETLRLPLS